MFETLRNHLTPFLNKEAIEIIDVSAKELGEDANDIYEKDLYESIGFQNGFKPWTDSRAVGMLGPLVALHTIERIEDVYFEA